MFLNWQKQSFHVAVICIQRDMFQLSGRVMALQAATEDSSCERGLGVGNPNSRVLVSAPCVFWGRNIQMFLCVTSAHYREGAMALLSVCEVDATNVLHSNVPTYCLHGKNENHTISVWECKATKGLQELVVFKLHSCAEPGWVGCGVGVRG